VSGDPRPKSPPKERKPRKPLRSRRRTQEGSETEFHPAVRAEVQRRAGGKCEAQTPVCDGHPFIMHHRRRRSQGGKGTVANALFCCATCHTYIHSIGAQAYEQGWLLKSDAR
jgi:hypothetical protein